MNTEDKKSGSFSGVFISARNLENNGKIISEGKGATTQIITENYHGTGEVSA